MLYYIAAIATAGLVFTSTIIFWDNPDARPWIGSLGLALGFLALWIVPHLQAPTSVTAGGKEPVEIENDTRRTIAQIIGGAFVLIGLGITYQQLVATQNSVDIARRTENVAERGQYTDRFTRAAGQLQSKRVEIRIAGIYALEQLAGRAADDSVISQQAQENHWPIMQVLTTFVRTHSSVTKPCREVRGTSDHLCADVQAALTVIGRRDTRLDPGGQPIDLEQADIQGASLDRENFAHALLSGADLRDASFIDAHLEGAHLDGALATNARMDGAHLDNAYVVNLNPQILGAGSDRGTVALMNAHLAGAQLDGAYLRYAFLCRADMRTRNLAATDLTDAPLKKADLRGADLSLTVGLTQQQLKLAITDSNTKPPFLLSKRKVSSGAISVCPKSLSSEG